MAEEKLYKAIDINDINLYSFEVYKDYNISSEQNFDNSTGFYLNRGIISLRDNEYPNQKIAISTSLAEDEPKNADNKEQKLYYYQLKQQFYDKNYYSINNEFVNTLYYSSSILTLPYFSVGEGIKRNSFKLFSDGIILHDDGHGNIIDSSLSLPISQSNNILYLSANNNDNFDKILFELNKNKNTKIFNDSSVELKKIGIDENAQSIYFDINSHLLLDDTENLQYFNIDNDYTISFWVCPEAPLENDTIDKRALISKRYYKKLTVLDKSTNISEYIPIYEKASIYPFEINIVYSSHIEVKGTDGLNSYNIVANNFANYESWHHIALVKKNDNMNLYVDNVKYTIPYGLSLNQNTNSLIQIGGLYAGYLDELRIYNTSLSDLEINDLYDSNHYFQTNKIGNIFYNSGFICLNDVRPKYQSILFTTKDSIDKNNFNFVYQSTQRLFENEIICKIRKDEFNHTLNPTVRKNNNIETTILENFATSSDFHPFITEIGLYNDEHELLAIGKLAEPVAKLNNIDMSFLLRFDI